MLLPRTVLVYSGIFTFLVDAYPTFAASALAANSFMRSGFGGIFPLFGIQSKPTLLLSLYLTRVKVLCLHAERLEVQESRILSPESRFVFVLL